MKQVFLIQHLHNGQVVAAFSNAKKACAYADIIDHGYPDPDYHVFKMEVRTELPIPPEPEK